MNLACLLNQSIIIPYIAQLNHKQLGTIGVIGGADGPTTIFLASTFPTWFWWFLLFCDLIVPIIMTIAGRMMWKHPPKHINMVMGYRTKHSMKNMDTWKFAHEHCGKLWWKIGLLMLVLTVLVHLPFCSSSEEAVGILSIVVTTIQLIVLVGSALFTEAALKKTFHEDGTRR